MTPTKQRAGKNRERKTEKMSKDRWKRENSRRGIKRVKGRTEKRRLKNLTKLRFSPHCYIFLPRYHN